jgi:hypothetical protein
MNLEHDLGRFGWGLVEKVDQNGHDEFTRRVVIVMEDNSKTSRPSRLVSLSDRYFAFAIRSIRIRHAEFILGRASQPVERLAIEFPQVVVLAAFGPLSAAFSRSRFSSHSAFFLARRFF